MKHSNWIHWLAIIILGAGLNACGTEGDETNSPIPPQSQNKRMVSGAIQAIDSTTLKVNDLTFNHINVEPQYAGSPWSEPLKVGMMVAVTATDMNAEQIEINPLLTGILQPVNRLSSARTTTWQVNGIPVRYENAAAVAGNWVMVFGHYEQDGVVAATDIMPLSQQPVWLEVENRVTSLDTVNATFTLGSLQVDYQGAQIEDGPLVEGQWVEVYGRLEGNKLTAAMIEVEDDADWPDASELQGYVRYFDPTDGLLELDRQRRVWVTSRTRFEGGSRANLQPGRLVEVEVVNGNQAAEIEFEDDLDSGNNASGSQFKLSGLANWRNERLTINGIDFTLDTMTRFEDGLNRDNLDGRWVELDGIVQSGLNLVREIEPEQQDGSLELTGFVSGGTLWGYQATDPSLTVWEGKWADLECDFDGNWLSNCRWDD